MRGLLESRERWLQLSERREEATPLNPLAVIYRQLNKKITVFLKGGEKYTGVLTKVDSFMNLVLDDTIEEKSNKTAKYGRVLIRGNNILLVKTSEE